MVSIGSREVHAWRTDNTWRMGTSHRLAPAVHRSPKGAEPIGGRRKVDHERAGGGVTVENLSGVVTAPIFLLVPQVKLPKRLDLARDAERAVDGVPGLIVANWIEGH